MKIFFALTVTAVVHLPAFSQLKKVEKTFQQEKYKKCIELSRKSIKSGKDVPQLSYYQCRSYFELYGLSGCKDLTLLDKSLGLYPSFCRSKSIRDENFSLALKQELEKLSDSLSACNNHNKSRIYVRTLAAYFNDTLESYHTYFPKKTPKNSVSAVQQKKKDNASPAGQVKRKSSASAVSRSSVIRYAERFNGVPYKWGGEDSTGLDCSGFVLTVMRKFGYSFNHGAKDQSELGRQVNREELKQGDLVFFGKRYDTGKCKIDHVAMVHFADKEKLVVIHCTSKGVNVQEMKANEYWAKKILFYRNIID